MSNPKTQKRKSFRDSLAVIARPTESPTHQLLTPSPTVNRLLALSYIESDPTQPRTHIDPEKLAALSESIREHGVLQPVNVCPHPDPVKREAGIYMLRGGHRRTLAAQTAGLTEIPVHIVAYDEDPNAWLVKATLENMNQEPLNFLDLAKVYARLQESGLNSSQIASQFGVSSTLVRNTIRLLKLPLDLQNALNAGTLNMKQGLALLSYHNLTPQIKQALENKLTNDPAYYQRSRALQQKILNPPPGVTAQELRLGVTFLLNQMSEPIATEVETCAVPSDKVIQPLCGQCPYLKQVEKEQLRRCFNEACRHVKTQYHLTELRAARLEVAKATYIGQYVLFTPHWGRDCRATRIASIDENGNLQGDDGRIIKTSSYMHPTYPDVSIIDHETYLRHQQLERALGSYRDRCVLVKSKSSVPQTTLAQVRDVIITQDQSYEFRLKSLNQSSSLPEYFTLADLHFIEAEQLLDLLPQYCPLPPTDTNKKHYHTFDFENHVFERDHNIQAPDCNFCRYKTTVAGVEICDVLRCFQTKTAYKQPEPPVSPVPAAPAPLAGLNISDLGIIDLDTGTDDFPAATCHVCEQRRERADGLYCLNEACVDDKLYVQRMSHKFVGKWVEFAGEPLHIQNIYGYHITATNQTGQTKIITMVELAKLMTIPAPVSLQTPPDSPVERPNRDMLRMDLNTLVTQLSESELSRLDNLLKEFIRSLRVKREE